MEYKGAFKEIRTPGARACVRPTDEQMQVYDEYGALHFCFSYKFEIEHDIISDITNGVWDIITIGGALNGIPFLDKIDLYMPHRETLRFQASQDDKNNAEYRLYKYWRHHVSNVPPPGRYTDHKFQNVQDRSVDYWWKIRQRGLGKNARIAGVAEVVFVPDVLFDKAKADGFLAA